MRKQPPRSESAMQSAQEPMTAAVAAEACRTLMVLADARPCTRTPIEDAVGAVAAALSRHETDGSVSVTVCMALASLSNHDGGYTAYDGLAAAARALELHLGLVDAATAACCAVEAFVAYSHDTAVLRPRAEAALVAALQKHQADAAAAAAALNALNTLLCARSIGPSTGRANPCAARAPAVIEAMRHHADDEAVALQGFEVLMKQPSHGGSSAEIFRRDVIPLAVSILEAQGRSSAEVATAACEAVTKAVTAAASAPPNALTVLEAAVDCQIVPAIVDVMRWHGPGSHICVLLGKTGRCRLGGARSV